MFNKIASTVGAAVIVGGAMLGLTSPAQAESAPGCSSVTQIGSTGYIKSGGSNIGSVKQFKGCNKNWAYVYVWESFRNSHSNWDVCVSVASGRSEPFTLEDLQCYGKKADNWSSGAKTLSVCTHAVGNIQWGTNKPNGKTDIRC
jgi:hypothetical protein